MVHHIVRYFATIIEETFSVFKYHWKMPVIAIIGKRRKLYLDLCN